MALARLGRFEAALKIVPDKTAKTENVSVAAKQGIIEGNEKITRKLITPATSNKRDELNLLRSTMQII